VVGAVPDDDPSSAVLDVLQVQGEDLAWTQAALEHEQHHGLVAPAPERSEQEVYLRG
jgi:hypothetical protein